MRSPEPLISYLLPFLEYCEVEKGLSNNTQRNYEQYLKLFSGWLKKTSQAKLLPHELTAKHIWNYRLYLARIYKKPVGGTLGRKSQNYYLIALRAFLNYLVDQEIDTLASSKVKLAKQKDDHTVSFLEARDIKKMLSIPDISTFSGLRDRAIMELFFSSGMRVSELSALDVSRLSFLDDKSRARTYELSIIGKGGRVRTIFISPRAAEWLRKYLAARQDVFDPLFINRRTRNKDTKRLTTRSIQKMISRYAVLAGLPKRVTPHTLRHSYATDLLAHGADLRSVQELLGHKNVATTQIYTHITNKRLRDVHEKFHGGRELGT